MGADMQPVFDIVTLGHLLQAEVQAMIADLSQQWLVPPLGTMEVSPEGGLQALYALEKGVSTFLGSSTPAFESGCLPDIRLFSNEPGAGRNSAADSQNC
jgi:hypothetical protein